jgi:hypothetical protein
MAMWWGFDIVFFFVGLPFIKPCGHVGLAFCPPLVGEKKIVIHPNPN